MTVDMCECYTEIICMKNTIVTFKWGEYVNNNWWGHVAQQKDTDRQCPHLNFHTIDLTFFAKWVITSEYIVIHLQ